MRYLVKQEWALNGLGGSYDGMACQRSLTSRVVQVGFLALWAALLTHGVRADKTWAKVVGGVGVGCQVLGGVYRYEKCGAVL